MSTFKVICKADGNDWSKKYPTTKIITNKIFFGLLKNKIVISERERVPGPRKEEVCIVIQEVVEAGGKYYELAGYPYGPYDARYFVRMDEFTETQKEIAETAEPVLN